MLKNFLRDEDGQGMVEYALILALIAVVVIVAVRALGQNAQTQMQTVADEIGGAQGNNP